MTKGWPKEDVKLYSDMLVRLNKHLPDNAPLSRWAREPFEKPNPMKQELIDRQYGVGNHKLSKSALESIMKDD